MSEHKPHQERLSKHEKDEGIRSFHVGDILSILHDCLLSPRRIEGVYDILNYMTDDDLYTHQLPRAIRECGPQLRQQFPELAALEVPGFDPAESVESVYDWVDSVAARFGRERSVLPLPPEDHTAINPIDELHMMGHGDKLIPIEAPFQEL